MEKFESEEQKLKVVDRIKKLLAIGDRSKNPNEAEVQTAMRMAREYMEKYGPEMSDVEIENSGDGEIESLDSEREGVIRHWEQRLAMAVCKICDVTVILGNGKGWHHRTYLIVLLSWKFLYSSLCSSKYSSKSSSVTLMSLSAIDICDTATMLPFTDWFAVIYSSSFSNLLFTLAFAI